MCACMGQANATKKKGQHRQNIKRKKDDRCLSNPLPLACEATVLSQCTTAYVLIGANGWYRVSQFDFSSYFSHSALLIKITGSIRSSRRLSTHHRSFICVLLTLYLKYYQLHYISAIHFVQEC